MRVFFAFKKRSSTMILVAMITFLFNMPVYGQSGLDGNWGTISLLLILIVLIFAAISLAGGGMVQAISAKKSPAYLKNLKKGEMEEFPYHTLKKGMDISLKGESESDLTVRYSSRYALQPVNFNDIQPIPKVYVEEGDEILAGQPLFFDKRHPGVNFVSPVSGEMAGIIRGAKRAVTEVIVLADKEVKFKKLNSPDLEKADRETLRNFLKENGGWPLFLQRPFNVLPGLDSEPRDIFVSTFDTAPLAGDTEIKIDGRYDALQKGVDVLKKLTDGKVYFGMDGRKGAAVPPGLMQIRGVEKHFFSGAHPCGNVGIQIHHIKPIMKGEVVWTIGLQELITLGNMFLSDIYDASRILNISGTAAGYTGYVKTYLGADLNEILPDEIKNENVRVICGNVLHGNKKDEKNSFIDFYCNQITVIPEGREYEMFGWMIPHTIRPTASRTFPHKLLGKVKYEVDTNTHGERRAFVMTGEYEELLPVDTYPQHLFKGIVTQNIDTMEGLGIYELVEEDVALCEFACTSKQPLQEILREGMDLMLRES